MEERLKKILPNFDLFEKIAAEHKKYGTLSSSFLIRKFKFNDFLAKKIISIFGIDEKNVTFKRSKGFKKIQ